MRASFDVCGANQIAVLEVSKVEFDPGSKAVVEWCFIDGGRGIGTVVGGGVKVPRRIHVGAVMGR